MWILLAATAALLVWAVVVYNRLVGLSRRAEGAWADIDAQLKRRHDLVPALVETVKGYAAHERGTLEEVVSRRSEAVRAESEPPDADRALHENRLAGALKGLFALAEAYPELRASERFGQLQEQLVQIEDALQNARRYYNAVVRDLNTALHRFPDLLVGRGLGFAEREFFELDSPLEGRAPEVSLHG